LQGELQPVESVIRHALPPPFGHQPYSDTPSRRFQEEMGRSPD